MNWPEDEREQDAAPEAEAAGEESDSGLYPGDSGELPLDTRRALVLLLSGPSLDARRHSKLWPVLARDEVVIRSRLSDVFLDLVVDHDQQVAFTRQVEPDGLDVPRLLRRVSLTFIESALLLLLRQRLTQADAQGERAVVSTDEIVDSLGVYEQAGNTDRAGFERRINSAIEKAKKYSVLHKIRSAEDRYEISPTLKLLFSAEEISALTRIYLEMGAPEDDREQHDGPPLGEGTE